MSTKASVALPSKQEWGGLKPIAIRPSQSVMSSPSTATVQPTADDDLGIHSPLIHHSPLGVHYPDQSNLSLGPPIIPPSHEGTSSSVSLGVAVRYANAPYGVSKVISIMPRYLFFSRLPFSVIIKDARAGQTLKRSVGRSSRVPPVRRPSLINIFYISGSYIKLYYYFYVILLGSTCLTCW